MNNTIYTTLDIETLGTPENSGYGIVVPSYALVHVPEKLSDDLNWMYVQLPIQEQLDIGLKTDASAMNFWFNICASEFPEALKEMQKSFTLTKPNVIINGKNVNPHINIPIVIKDFINGSLTSDVKALDKDVKVFGNGCHFDCSILQENHRQLFGNANLWHYTAPNNIRTLRLLISEQDEQDMKEAVQPHLDAFVQKMGTQYTTELQLHNPIYDAAKEALFARFILDLKKSS